MRCAGSREGRTLLHVLFAASGDIRVTTSELHIKLAPLSPPHRTRAAQTLCESSTKPRPPSRPQTCAFASAYGRHRALLSPFPARRAGTPCRESNQSRENLRNRRFSQGAMSEAQRVMCECIPKLCTEYRSYPTVLTACLSGLQMNHPDRETAWSCQRARTKNFRHCLRRLRTIVKL